MDTEMAKFVKKQIRETMIKVRGALNLIEDNKPIFARNKILGINQKLGYIYNQMEEYEKSGLVPPDITEQIKSENNNNSESEPKN